MSTAKTVQDQVARPSARPLPVAPKLIEIVERVTQVAASERVQVRDVLRAIGDAGFAPVLLIPAVAVATPLSGIPLFSSLMGIIIALVSAQMLARRDHLWLPRWILDREVKGRIVVRAFGYVRPVARWLDARTNRRLVLLVRPPFVFVPQLICLLSGIFMPILEFVPFSSSIVGMSVAILALGMVSRDGLVLLLGLVPYSVVFGLISRAIAG